MRIAYLDCFSGISGDMFQGALVDAGVPAELLEKTVEALDVGARLEISRVDRSGISAIKVDVYSHGEKDLPREEYVERESGVGSQPEAHGHSHGENQGPRAGAPAPQEHIHDSHEHPHHGHGRGLKEIREIIRKAEGISEGAKSTAIAIFENLGKAEAKIHHMPVEQVHFHEVGAVDAMVDIVCAAVGAETLQVEEWVCSPLNAGGGGLVFCTHGTLPVPAPATLELLKDAPVYSLGPAKELVTPTGAAIVKTLTKRYGAFPSMKVETTGYGAGTRDFTGHPNVLRITLGDSEITSARAKAEAEARAQKVIAVLEASIDDLNPQVFGYVIERALAEGALDAYGTPLQMKKNRPGMLLTVLARRKDAERLAKLIFAETSTLGVRIHHEQRQALSRRWVSVQTRWGEVRMKVGSLNGSITNYAPEYEDCRKIAGEQHLPLKSVMQEAIRVYLAGAEPHQHG